MGDCTPGDYWCHPVGNNYLLICDANAKWAISADCGKYGPYGCCRGTAWPGPDHRCDCRPRGSESIESSISKEAATTVVEKRVDSSTTSRSIDKPGKTTVLGQDCEPGQYHCDTHLTWILVCSHERMWQLSPKCGSNSSGHGCCENASIPGGSPFCDCRDVSSSSPGLLQGNTTQTSSVAVRSIRAVNETISPLQNCKSGDYMCSPFSYGWILVCDHAGSWQYSANCGKTSSGSNCCRQNPGSPPFCDCRGLPGGSPGHLIVTNQTVIPATFTSKRSEESKISAKSCTPGQYWCDPGNFEWIMVCNLKGQWINSSWCGETKEGFGCCRGSSIPGPPPSCDCRGLPGGPPALSNDDGHNETVGHHSIKNLTVTSNMASKAPERCTPGTYRCKPPFTQGWLQVCGQDRIWYLANQCCGPYTCVDILGDELPRCECSPKPRSLVIDSTSASDTASSTPHLDQATGKTKGCQPGTYSCAAQNTAPLMVCSAQGEWQVADTCCGLHTCRQGVNPGTAYCNCPHILEATGLPSAENTTGSHPSTEASNAPQGYVQKGTAPPTCDAGTYSCWETENPKTLMVCGADRTWYLSNNCCGPNSCVEGPASGTAFCKCSPTPRSSENSLLARSLDSSQAHPTSGPEDPDEPEFCTPGRFTCGDTGSKVYTCNIKGNWQLSATCTSDHTCARGYHGVAYCVKVGQGTSEPADDVRGSAEEGLTTLLTVAKEAASSTARA